MGIHVSMDTAMVSSRLLEPPDISMVALYQLLYNTIS